MQMLPCVTLTNRAGVAREGSPPRAQSAVMINVVRFAFVRKPDDRCEYSDGRTEHECTRRRLAFLVAGGVMTHQITTLAPPK